MVRLVFRPYTQVRKAICTSAHLRASTRVSSGFALLRHSSPSFGSQQVRSYSNLSQKIMVGRWCRHKPSHQSVSLRLRVFHPPTRVHVRLLGPCFKTGPLTALRQHLEDADHRSERPSFLSPARGIGPRHRGVSPARRTHADQRSAHNGRRWATF